LSGDPVLRPSPGVAGARIFLSKIAFTPFPRGASPPAAGPRPPSWENSFQKAVRFPPFLRQISSGADPDTISGRNEQDRAANRARRVGHARKESAGSTPLNRAEWATDKRWAALLFLGLTSHRPIAV
jgi:hypothetical protein